MFTANLILFILTASFGAFSIFLYVTTDIVIIRYRKQFDSSFFQLYFYESILNMILYSINFFSMRLSSLATENSFLGRFYVSLDNDIFLNFILGMRYHMAFVQYATISIISINRLSVLKNLNSEHVWKKYSLPLFVLVFCFPFIVTCVVFNSVSRFEYVRDEELYSLLSRDMKVGFIYAFLIPFMVFSMVVSFAANFISICNVKLFLKNNSRAEINYVIIMTITCAIQLIGTIISIAIVYAGTSNTEYLKLALPYVSELLTLVQPWLLVFFSQAIKEKMRDMLCCKVKISPVMFKHTRSATSLN